MAGALLLYRVARRVTGRDNVRGDEEEEDEEEGEYEEGEEHVHHGPFGRSVTKPVYIGSPVIVIVLLVFTFRVLRFWAFPMTLSPF